MYVAPLQGNYAEVLISVAADRIRFNILVFVSGAVLPQRHFNSI